MAKKESDHQKAICAVLHRLRVGIPKFRDDAYFASKSGVKDGTIKSVERGKITPTLPIIERWLNHCGSSLAKFFAEVEKEETGKPADVKSPRIFHGREPLYELLTEILEAGDQTGNSFFVDGIHANLVALAASAQNAIAKGTQYEKEAANDPKERKKPRANKRAGLRSAS